MLHRCFTAFRVARTIGQEETIKVQLVEVIIPRNTDDFYATLEETADDVGFHAAIDEDNAL